MNRALSRILALVLLAGVAFFVARPYLQRDAPDSATPPVVGLVAAEPRRILESDPLTRRLDDALDARLQLQQLGTATVEHELRFNEYDFAWLDDEADVNRLLRERPGASRDERIDPPTFVALTPRGAQLGDALVREPALRAPASDAREPAPTTTTDDEQRKATNR